MVIGVRRGTLFRVRLGLGSGMEADVRGGANVPRLVRLPVKLASCPGGLLP